MPRLGTSFTKWRAQALGLDYRRAFSRVCGMGFDLIRLSASWQEVHQFGFEHLDWLVAHAETAGQRVLLTVGMKALGWPEFHLPPNVQRIDAGAEQLAIAHVKEVVGRFASRPAVVAWQVENEPFNRSGPNGWWLPRATVRREARAVRSIDPTRPLVLTTFAHFDDGLDRSSSRYQSNWLRRLGLAIPPEREALAVLGKGDVLGVDVYRAIGFVGDGGQEAVAHAAEDQIDSVAHWRRIARQQGKQLWVTEAQAEPWEAHRRTHGDPRSVQPADVIDLVGQLDGIGVEVILLWGSEYWLWRKESGDPRWVDAVALGLKTLARG
jgi:cellulase (glycosyl hydrolase family 5)